MPRPLLAGSALLCTLVVVLGLGDTAHARKKKKNALVNTTWTGRESLAGYGDLTFKFKPQGAVTMIDAKETRSGRFTLDGKDVKLTFFDGEVVYTGKLDGQSMSGIARNAGKAWTWEVTRQKKKKGKG
jgi:hypothetical protein